MPDPTPSSLKARIKRQLLTTRAGRVALVAPRAFAALRAARLVPRLGQVLGWSVRSREIANFTYDTTRDSKLILCGVVAGIVGRPTAEIRGYLDELEADRDLAAYVETAGAAPENRWQIDPGFRPGRRLAYYLMARGLKPNRIVEAGVDKGLGAVLLSRALALNAADGQPGEYLGIEYDRAKPIALYDGYPGKLGHIVRDDSLAVIRTLTPGIGLFIHDTIADHDHMKAQLEAVAPLMHPHGVLASTWTTPAVLDHVTRHGLGLLTHQEEPIDHWFPGDRMAFVYGYETRTR